MNAGAALKTVDPVVVCGPPRTGVCLLATLLHSNPGFVTGPELPLVVTMARQWQDIVTTLGENHERHYGVSRDQSRAAFRHAILQLVAQQASATRTRFVMHSFSATLVMEIFAEMFPESRFIVMTRDPRDVVRSLLTSRWLHPREGKPLAYTQDAHAAAKFWLDFTRTAVERAPPLTAADRLLFMRYEDLCRNPVGVLAELAHFLGVPKLHPAIEASSFSGAAAVGMVAPALRAGPIDQRSIGLWRTTLTANQCSQIDAVTRGLRVSLGYS
jgi:Sulfotransferase family